MARALRMHLRGSYVNICESLTRKTQKIVRINAFL